MIKHFRTFFRNSGLKFIGTILIVMMLFPVKSLSQRKEKSQGNQIVTKGDSTVGEWHINLYNFPNINENPEYYNKSKLTQIKKLEAKKEWHELYLELQDYVQQFGVRNFYVDTYWIWRLAKLTEIYGTEDEAIALYKLVLRHHHEQVDVKEIELYTDILNDQEIENFVPLDYYYQLVEHRKAIDTIRPPRGVLLNMGRKINSRYADYGPSIGFHDEVLLFTSKKNELRKGLKHVQNEDIFISRKESGGFWKLSEELKDINSHYNEGSACLSKDGKTLIFSRCESPKSIGGCDLFIAKMDEDSVWSSIQNMGVNVNSVGWDSHPSLTHSEDTLYFASDRIGGFGLSDIYFTYKDENGAWTAAQNVGPIINTRNNEVSPFYHPEYEVLFFSSNGQLYKFGEFDIYKSYHRDGKWSEPYNIGPLVNGKGSEFYFTMDSKSQNLYYARSATRDLDKLDIYSFPLPMEAQPMALTPVTGSLSDSETGEPFTSGIVSIVDLDDGIEIAPRYLNPDGTFEFDLINDKDYLLIIQGDEFFRIEETFHLNGPINFAEVAEHISSKMKFASIEFDPGKAHLKSEMYGDLNKIVNFMYDNPDFYLVVSGHTDQDGSADLNLQLSKDRADVIRDYIVEFGGVEGYRVESEGYGSAKPLVDEVTEADQNLNRRVEFDIFRPAVQTIPKEDTEF
ncbi:OmpA family protein [Reichenbachiella versicolor]|uniref:OmpA family protein n=1 Tax=Reichenbachiella versicolor TaxID=1821036 RepID=UPI001FEBEC1C|nr:OmpA family protein [Reichenbachiella versicolor]